MWNEGCRPYAKSVAQSFYCHLMTFKITVIIKKAHNLITMVSKELRSTLFKEGGHIYGGKSYRYQLDMSWVTGVMGLLGWVTWFTF